MDMNDLMIGLIIGITVLIVWRMIVDWLGISFKRSRQIQDIPRDSMTRIKRDLMRSAKISRPFGLRELWLSGDKEVPRSKVGRIRGMLPTLNYYAIVYRPRVIGRTRVLLVERELVSSVLLRVMTVNGRGIETHGQIWDFVSPLDNFEKTLKMQNLEYEESLNELWLRRACFVQVLMEQHATIERIEIRRHAETRAVLPKADVRALLMRDDTKPESDEYV